MTPIEALSALLIDYYAVRTKAPVSEEDRARLGTIAQAIVEECDENPIPGFPKKACLALATNTPMWESGFLPAVHSGALLGKAGERCLYQLHRGVTAIPFAAYRVTQEELENTTGTDLEHTRNCVRVGMRVARWHLHRCGLKYEGGGWFTIAAFYAEYHHPSTVCRAVISPMSSRRAMAYTTLLYKIGRWSE